MKQVEVKLVSPVKQKLVHTISQPGTLRANEEAMIHAKVVGYAALVMVDIGAKVKGPVYETGGKLVKQGSKLLVVDVPEIVEEVQHKKALMDFAKVGVDLEKKQAEVADAFLLSTEAGLVEARAGIQRAQASYDRWHSENKRVSALVQSKVLDEQTRDEVLNLVKAAESTKDEIMAKVKHAEATVAKSKAEAAKARIAILSAESRLDVTKAELRKAEALAAYTTIYAPFDGVVTKRSVDPGKLVQDNSSPNTEPLFIISQIDPVRVVVDVPEIENAYVNPGCARYLSCTARERVFMQGISHFMGLGFIKQKPKGGNRSAQPRGNFTPRHVCINPHQSCACRGFCVATRCYRSHSRWCLWFQNS
jgi:multidrug resistance efflux pump